MRKSGTRAEGRGRIKRWESGAGWAAFPLACVPGRWVAKPVAADSPQTAWQDMAKVAGAKFGSGKRFSARCVTVGAVFPRKCDMCIADLEDAGVADGGAANVGTKIFDHVFAIAKGLEVDAPVLVPHGRIDHGHRMVGG